MNAWVWVSPFSTNRIATRAKYGLSGTDRFCWLSRGNEVEGKRLKNVFHKKGFQYGRRAANRYEFNHGYIFFTWIFSNVFYSIAKQFKRCALLKGAFHSGGWRWLMEIPAWIIDWNYENYVLYFHHALTWT